MGLNVDIKQTKDIDALSKNQLTHELDSYSNIPSPFSFELTTFEDGITGKWVRDATGLTNEVIGENEFLRFNLGCIPQLKYKTVLNIKLNATYKVCNNFRTFPVITGLGIGKDNVLSYIHPEVYLNGSCQSSSTVSYDCKTFNYSVDNLNKLLHDDGFMFEVLITGNLSASKVIFTSLSLEFEFESSFKEERDAIKNKFPKFLVWNDTEYEIKIDNNKIVLEELE